MKPLVAIGSSRAAALAVVMVAMLLILIGCDSRANEKDMEQEQALFLYVLRPEARSECQKSEGTALSCATAAGLTEAAYVSRVEAAWRISVPAHASGGSAAAICTALPGSPNWQAGAASHADTGKACHLRCNQEYYQQALEGGRCTSGSYADLQTALAACGPFVWKTTCSVEQMRYCLNACLVQGTLL